MPMYWGDYLGDTGHLTTAQHGAYLLLIAHHWRTGPLPDDDRQLCKIARADPRTWSATLRPVVAQFFRIEGGRWYQDRVIREADKALEIKAKYAGRAAAAAEKRWGKRDATSMKPPMLGAMLEQCPSPSPIEANASISIAPIGASSPKAAPSVDLLGDPDVGKLNGHAPKRPNCPTEAIVDLYHAAVPTGRRCMVLTEARRKSIVARWRHYAAEKKWATPAEGLEFFRKYFEFVSRSPFLTGQRSGQNGRPFEVGIEWLMRAENWAKTVEGKYHG